MRGNYFSIYAWASVRQTLIIITICCGGGGASNNTKCRSLARSDGRGHRSSAFRSAVPTPSPTFLPFRFKDFRCSFINK